MQPYARLTISFPDDYYLRFVRLSNSLQYSFEDLIGQSLELYATMRTAILARGQVMMTVDGRDRLFSMKSWPLNGGWTLEKVAAQDTIYRFGLSEQVYQSFIRLMDNSSSYPAEILGSALGAYEKGMQVLRKKGTVWVDLQGERCDIFVVDK
jgi:hypothetical protein